jgi:hypothetical protein
MENARLDLLRQVIADQDNTQAKFLALLRHDVNAHPLLYFGDPLSARFATFGVNPSAAEFTRSRWPKATLTTAELDKRSVEYFKNPEVQAHPWFHGYETALNLLGHSYKSDAVHLDLSPRATKSMESVDRTQFLQMIESDMKWFLRSLALCSNLKAAIMSGSVTGKYYFDEFLLAKLPKPFSVQLRTRFDLKRRGATALYDLSGPNLNLPVLFCCKSPSGDKAVFLKREVSRLRAELAEAGFAADCQWPIAN